MPEYLKFKKLWILSPQIQILSICVLYVTQVIFAYISFLNTGKIFQYPSSSYMTLIFAPIYEEVIFRGFVLNLFLNIFSVRKAIIYSSLIFGIWHLKNIFFLDSISLTKQVLYTGLIFGPVVTYISYKTKSVWISSIIHNNNILFFGLTLT